MAASSSSKPRRGCQVFLSFRGEDVRKTFVSHLHAALVGTGICAYIDSEDLRMGEEISKLMNAIEESRIAIIVFSEHYASSTWCLKEVAKIMDCKAQNDLIVLPVFFKVEPREVRTPRAQQSYGIDMAEHEVKYGKDSEKVKSWKKALLEAGSLSGRVFTEEGNESEAALIRQIVDEILTQLDRMPLDVAQYQVGIDFRAEEIKTILKLQSKDDVLMVGLWGQGGIGKTTLAKAVYNAIFRDFQGSCFLERVRENSKTPDDLVHLQEQLLSQVLLNKNKARVFGVDRGSQLIQDRLFNKRVLIMLDDVDYEGQLSALARSCKWFGEGSRIIVTTRSKGVLNSLEGDFAGMYEVKVLKNNEAVELFRKYAFPKNQEIEIPSDLVDSVLHYAGCHPLGLKVLGSSLCGRGEQQWKLTLEALAKSSNEEMNDVLKVSYYGLKSYATKEIFLDIACFFKGRRIEYIKKVLDSCGFQTEKEVKILIENSLISEENGTLQMHDLMQSMGMDIVLEECRDDPGKRSRLWLQDDVFDVLSRDEGTKAAKAIVLELPEPKKIYISPLAFKKMMKLRLLILLNVDNSSPDPIHLPNSLMWFQWPNCPLVPEFSKGPKKLVGLDMWNSENKVPEQFKDFQKLKFINYSKCESLVYMPDLKFTPDLQELDLHGCKNLKRAHESLAHHDKLRLLNLSGCSKLQNFPKKLESMNLELLNLSLCSKLQRFPEIPDKMEGLRGLFLTGTSIKELPVSIRNLVSLEEMDLRYCTKLRILPSSIYRLQNLERLTLEGCSNLDKFPKNEEDPSDPHTKTGFPKLYVLNLRGCNLSELDFLESSCFPFLRALYLLGNNFTDLPTCEQLHNLLWLDISHTQQLQEIPRMPGQLSHLWAIGCESMSKFPPTHATLQQFRPKTDCRVLLPGGEMPARLLPDKEAYLSWLQRTCTRST